MFALAPTNSTPTNNPVYALIIGVSDYTAFDPSGGLNLPGATNDTEHWVGYCRHTLGLDDASFQRLSDADGAEATSRASIIAGLKWLGQQLGKQETVNGASALLTFSGHGLTVEHTGDDNLAEGLSLALAPSDIDASLASALLFSHIEEILFEAVASEKFGTTALTDGQSQVVYEVLQNVTAVFDACYSRPSTAQTAIRSLSVDGPTPKLPQLKVFSRLILGAHLWETAYEIKTGDVWHGAFTYAFVTMLEQWRVQTDAQTPVYYSRAAYGDVVFRARNLLSTLGMPDQTPTLLGSQNNLALVPFLRPGVEINAEWTSVEPDGPRRREEFSTENTDAIIIEITSGSTIIGVALYVATGATYNGATFGDNTVQWYFNTGHSGSTPNFSYNGYASYTVKITPIFKWPSSGLSVLSNAMNYSTKIPVSGTGNSRSFPQLWTGLSSDANFTNYSTNDTTSHTTQAWLQNGSGTAEGTNDSTWGFQIEWTIEQIPDTDPAVYFPSGISTVEIYTTQTTWNGSIPITPSNTPPTSATSPIINFSMQGAGSDTSTKDWFYTLDAGTTAITPKPSS